ncbi:MAG TPA: C1 family peptidase, partial [Cytophagales bacterium]|nr:C1 family peptidase [Cytophagales bacterium]
MPIRVTDDNSGDFKGNVPGGSGRRGSGNRGGGGLGGILPSLLGMVFRNPKVGIPLLIIAGLFFYFGRGCGGSSFQSDQKMEVGTGCAMKQEVYDKASQFEQLDAAYNPLPEAISLQEYCPHVGNQGTQGSCVGWSSSYGARTILHNISTGQKNTAFSPAFLYNQIGMEGCQGAYLNHAMQTLENVGDVDIDKFPYDEQDCTRKPSQQLQQEAAQYKIKGFSRLSKDANEYQVDMLAIKQNLARQAPVVIGMSVGGTFMQMMGQEMWIPSEDDYAKNGFSGHAMCVVGYDDFKEFEGKRIGSFLLMNSWGPEFGKKGFIWVPYEVFEYFVVEA